MNKEKHLETILVLVLALLIVYWLFFKVPALLIAAGILTAIGVFIPFLAAKIHWAWMKLAHALGFIMNKVLLTIIFFLVVLPLALLSRAFGKNTVQLKRNQTSYFKERNFTYNKESLENVW